MKYQDERYEECFQIVNDTYQGINIVAPEDKPWECIGVIPQLNNEEHRTKVRYHELVQIKDLP